MSRLAEAQGQRLASLIERAADRPAHTKYIEALMAADYEDLMEVEAPSGVSRRVADAILDDVFWIRQPETTGGGFVSQYQNAYSNRRMADARAARDRAKTRAAHEDTLESMLQIKPKKES